MKKSIFINGGHMKKIFILLILIFIFSTPICYAFSDGYTWSVLNNSIEASASLQENEEILDNNCETEDSSLSDELREKRFSIKFSSILFPGRCLKPNPLPIKIIS